MTPAWQTLILALANKALIPHAEASRHAEADRRIREAVRDLYGEQCADTDGLCVERRAGL